MTDELTALRERYPAWHIEIVWVARTAGPDVRSLRATAGNATLSAATPAALAALIEDEQAGH